MPSAQLLLSALTRLPLPVALAAAAAAAAAAVRASWGVNALPPPTPMLAWGPEKTQLLGMDVGATGCGAAAGTLTLAFRPFARRFGSEEARTSTIATHSRRKPVFVNGAIARCRCQMQRLPMPSLRLPFYTMMSRRVVGVGVESRIAMSQMPPVLAPSTLVASPAPEAAAVSPAHQPTCCGDSALQVFSCEGII